MRYILFLILPMILFSSSSFITPLEYASQLYKNPRGIGCGECHGEYGEGMVIAEYMHKNEKKTFSAPAINTIGFEEFYKVLNKRNKGMPRYFLTNGEIKALYLYLHQNDKKKEK